MMAVRNPEELYHNLMSYWRHPTEVVLEAKESPTILTQSSDWARLADISQRMMFLDLATYLPDDILAKVDRASMGVSLEARVPILDHRVVEFAARIPLSMKIRSGQTKWLLRKVLYRYVPRELVERPKMGFGIPIEDWLRGPLRDWAEELMNEDRLRREGFFRPEAIRELWAVHLSRQRNRHGHLWNVLMFQAWREKWG
jgi:asparagine synthase (glutamine-hydrolysing)